MLEYIIILAQIVLGIIGGISIVSFCTLIMLKNDGQTTISYMFSKKLFEIDYPDTSFFHYWNE